MIQVFSSRAYSVQAQQAEENNAWHGFNVTSKSGHCRTDTGSM